MKNSRKIFSINENGQTPARFNSESTKEPELPKNEEATDKNPELQKSWKFDTDRLLTDLGVRGRYQMWIYFWLNLASISSAWHMMVMTFQNADPPHTCTFGRNFTAAANHTALENLLRQQNLDQPPSSAQKYSDFPAGSSAFEVHEQECSVLINSTDPSSNLTLDIPCFTNGTYLVYDESFGHTIVSEWNLTCSIGRKAKASTAGSIYMFGVMLGAITIPSLGDRFGRMWPYLICMWAIIPLTIGLHFVQSYNAFVAARFFTGAVFMGKGMTAWSMSCELIASSWRSWMVLYPSMMWVAGYVVLGVLAYFICISGALFMGKGMTAWSMSCELIASSWRSWMVLYPSMMWVAGYVVLGVLAYFICISGALFMGKGMTAWSMSCELIAPSWRSWMVLYPSMMWVAGYVVLGVLAYFICISGALFMGKGMTAWSMSCELIASSWRSWMVLYPSMMWVAGYVVLGVIAYFICISGALFMGKGMTAWSMSCELIASSWRSWMFLYPSMMWVAGYVVLGVLAYFICISGALFMGKGMMAWSMSCELIASSWRSWMVLYPSMMWVAGYVVLGVLAYFICISGALFMGKGMTAWSMSCELIASSWRSWMVLYPSMMWVAGYVVLGVIAYFICISGALFMGKGMTAWSMSCELIASSWRSWMVLYPSMMWVAGYVVLGVLAYFICISGALFMGKGMTAWSMSCELIASSWRSWMVLYPSMMWVAGYVVLGVLAYFICISGALFMGKGMTAWSMSCELIASSWRSWMVLYPSMMWVAGYVVLGVLAYFICISGALFMGKGMTAWSMSCELIASSWRSWMVLYPSMMWVAGYVVLGVLAYFICISGALFMGKGMTAWSMSCELIASSWRSWMVLYPSMMWVAGYVVLGVLAYFICISGALFMGKGMTAWSMSCELIASSWRSWMVLYPSMMWVAGYVVLGVIAYFICISGALFMGKGMTAWSMSCELIASSWRSWMVLYPSMMWVAGYVVLGVLAYFICISGALFMGKGMTAWSMSCELIASSWRSWMVLYPSMMWVAGYVVLGVLAYFICISGALFMGKGMTAWSMSCELIASSWRSWMVLYPSMMWVAGYVVLGVIAYFICISGALFMGKGMTAWSMSCELIASSWRSWMVLYPSMMWVAGYVILGILAYFIRDWRKLQLAISLPLLAHLFYPLCVRESIFWLGAKGKKGRLEKEVALAARVNHKTGLINPEKYYTPTDSGGTRKKSSFFNSLRQVFTTPTLALYAMIMCYSWFVDSLVYYGLSLFSFSLASNRYLSFCMSGVVEVPANVAIAASMHYLGRRATSCLFHGMAGVSLLVLPFIPETIDSIDSTDQSTSTVNLKPLILTFSLIGKFAISAAFTGDYLYAAEIYPTNLRTFGVGLSSFAARIGGVLAPYIGLLANIDARLPPPILGALSLACAGLVLLLPETQGQKLADSPQEMAKSKMTQEEKRSNCCSRKSRDQDTGSILNDGYNVNDTYNAAVVSTKL